jgi:hypothetical protein
LSAFLACVISLLSAGPAPAQADRPGTSPRQAEQVRQWALARGWVENRVAPTSQPAPLDAAAAPNGLVVFAPDRNRLGPPEQIPSREDLARPFGALTFPGEFESVPVAIHALRDFTAISVEVSDLTSAAGGRILAPDAVVRDVIYAPMSQRNRTASVNQFRLWPLWFVAHRPEPLKAGEGRLVWLTIRCPKNAPAGPYQGAVTVTAEPGGVIERHPLRLDVQPFALDASLCDWCPVTNGNGFDIELYRQLVEHHMTGLSWWWGTWGLTVTREGEGPNARASFDPTAMDLLNAVTREAGMRGPWILMFGNQVRGHVERRIAGLYGDHRVPALFDVKMAPCPPLLARTSRPTSAPAASPPAAPPPAPAADRRTVGQADVADLSDPEMARRYVELVQALARRAKEKGYPPLIVMPYDEPTRRLAQWNAHYCDLLRKHVPEVKILNNPQGSLRSAQLWMPYSDYMEVEGGDDTDIYDAALKAGKALLGYTRLWSNITFAQARYDLGLRFSVQQPKIIYFWSLNFGDLDPATPFNDLFERDSGFRHRFAWPPLLPGQPWIETVVWEAQREGAKDLLLLMMVERELAKSQSAQAAAIRKDFQAFKTEAALSAADLDQRRARLVRWYREVTGK